MLFHFRNYIKNTIRHGYFDFELIYLDSEIFQLNFYFLQTLFLYIYAYELPRLIKRILFLTQNE
jgi:hypothetical protein